MIRLETPQPELGQQAPDFNLKNIDDSFLSLNDCMGENGLLVMFICNHCPYVKSKIDHIVKDAETLKSNNIGVVAIMSNDVTAYPEDDFPNMQTWAKEKNFGFPYLFDETQEVAKAYGAVCTPDFFGYNASGELQFRGRLDDSAKEPSSEDSPRELVEAMLQIAKTGTGPEQQIPSMGCSIKWKND